LNNNRKMPHNRRRDQARQSKKGTSGNDKVWKSEGYHGGSGEKKRRGRPKVGSKTSPTGKPGTKDERTCKKKKPPEQREARIWGTRMWPRKKGGPSGGKQELLSTEKKESLRGGKKIGKKNEGQGKKKAPHTQRVYSLTYLIRFPR